MFDRKRSTSEESPIEVFWVEPAAHGAAGRLGLTFAPGKKGAGIATDVEWDRDLRQDMARLRDVHGTDLLVSLMEDHEYVQLRIPELFEVAAACGIRTERLPIKDVHTPRPGEEGAVDALIGAVRASLRRGEAVVIHCRGGHGRTGTIAALTLVSYGHRAEDAITLVREAQKHTVEHRRQAEYVSETERRWLQARTWTAPDRVRGALVGLATGDALGTAVEFRASGTFEPVTDMVGGGVFGLRPGEWTDDTSMALCLAESIVETGGFDPLDQVRRYVRWWREGHLSSNGVCFDIGTTTRAGLAAFERTSRPFSGPTSEHTAGNGSLMRLAPVPMACYADPGEAMRLAGESSRTTHGAPECVAACRYFAGLLVGAIDGAAKEELLAPNYSPVAPGARRAELGPDAGATADLTLAPGVAEVASGSFLRREPPEIAAHGYVVSTLEAALWAFARTDTFEEGALKAVNLGNDADTVGAVYGQLAGAFYGEGAIPERWRRKLALRDEIGRLADGLVALGGKARPPAGTRD